jgi:hypothetical protein
MFSGHYGAGFVAKRASPSIPLWVLFLAVQFLDLLWAPFVLMGIEKLRIVPGFTRSNALDLYYMPYTHSLVAALLWSCVGGILYQLLARPSQPRVSVVVGLAVFSHWVLDLIVHVPDLPLYDNAAKLGLGLWNAPVLSFCLEAALVLGGIGLCIRARLAGKGAVVIGLVMLTFQAYRTFLGPPPPSDRAMAMTALTAYIVFAITIWLAEDRRPRVGAA